MQPVLTKYKIDAINEFYQVFPIHTIQVKEMVLTKKQFKLL